MGGVIDSTYIMGCTMYDGVDIDCIFIFMI